MTTQPTEGLIELAEKWEAMALDEAKVCASPTCLSSTSRKQAQDILAMFDLAAALRARASQEQPHG